jgi:4-hydroxy-tetrahydrodipicolinate synthase
MPNLSVEPWHGVVVASATPFRSDGSVDLDRMQEHVNFLAEHGCHGITPAGSLGEYQTLTAAERSDLVRAAVEAAPAGFSVVPGVSAYGADEALRWAEQAAEAGADAVLCLPPTSYRADPADIVDHYVQVAKAGLPIVGYNNPFDTHIDLTPELIFDVCAAVAEFRAVKEFSGDVRRIHRIHELVPDLDVLAGADDVLVEYVAMGAVGWIAGFPNAIPRFSVELYDATRRGDLDRARDLYRLAHPLFRRDSHQHFVQAVKASMDAAGRYGGPCRKPRGELSATEIQQIAAETRVLMDVAVT